MLAVRIEISKTQHYSAASLVLNACRGEAKRMARERTASSPRTYMQLLERALDAQKNGRLKEAEDLYRRLIAAEPNNFDALHMLGIVCYENGKAVEAEQFFLKALLVDAKYPPLLHNYGLFLGKQKRYSESVEQFDKALKIFDRFPPVYSDRGNALMELGQLDAALASHNVAIKLAPNVPMLLYNRGNTLCRKGEFVLALEDYNKAIALRGDYADAYCGRGNAFRGLNRYQEALAAYQDALRLAPRLAEAWHVRGILLRELGRHEEAFSDFDKAFRLKPDLAGLPGDRLHSKMYLCGWIDFSAECTHLISSVRDGHCSTSPFIFLTVSPSAEDQLKCAKDWVAAENGSSICSTSTSLRRSRDRIRVAYLSTDFRQHAVASLIVGVFERHNRSRFEVTGISLGRNDNSALRARVQSSVEHFVDVQAASDDNVCKLLKDREIDIAVDMMGFTTGTRSRILARRPAPIQVNFLGYAGTTGAPYIDYIIADRVVIPEGRENCYSEAVVALPDSFFPGNPERGVAERALTRAEVGLPTGAFVFCCFNNSYKITPDVFDLWMRLLKAVDGSVLWLKVDNVTAERNLRLEAERRGVAPARLIFAPRLARVEDHLARQGQADLFLDTLPYNAHTTAAEALWAELPLVTCPGSTFASRVAASLLRAVGLAELITDSLADYEALALKLARDPSLLGAIKAKLANTRLTAPLFDNQRFATHLEAVYLEMWQRHQRGERPQAFAVAPQVV